MFGFALGTALLVSGILAAGSMLRDTRTAQLAPALKSAGRGGTAGPESGRVRGALVAAGTALGLVIAIVGTRALQSVLFVVRPGDPLTLLLIAALVLCVALAAILVPARRATKVDPMGALRSE